MTPKLPSNIEESVAAHPDGAIEIKGESGASYWIQSVASRELDQKLQVGIDQLEAGETSDWTAQSIIEEGMKILNEKRDQSN